MAERKTKPQSHSAVWLESMLSVSSTDSSDCTSENWLQEEESLAQLSLTTHRLWRYFHQELGLWCPDQHHDKLQLINIYRCTLKEEQRLDVGAESSYSFCLCETYQWYAVLLFRIIWMLKKQKRKAQGENRIGIVKAVNNRERVNSLLDRWERSWAVSLETLQGQKEEKKNKLWDQDNMPYISIYIWRVSEVHGDIKQRKVACYQ